MGKRNAKRVVSQPLNGLYLVLTLLLCIMMEILVFDRGYNKVQSEAELSVKEQVSLAANQLAATVTDTKDAYIMHSMDQKMNQILSAYDEPYTLEYIVELQYLKNAVYYFLSGNSLFADIGFVRREGSIITYNSLTNRDKEVLRQVVN